MKRLLREEYPEGFEALGMFDEFREDIAELRASLGRVLAARSMHHHHQHKQTARELEEAEAEACDLLGWD